MFCDDDSDWTSLLFLSLYDYGFTRVKLVYAPSSFLTDRFKAASLLQFFFVCASATSLYGVCFVIVCSSYLLLLVPREGFAS